ncbi:MAG: RNA polymerase factor sigma-54 [Bernardetiaceae bacterium]
MQKLHLNQTMTQKLSPQQIQFIKLLQIPTAELESRVKEELESNPALEEGREESEEPSEREREEERGNEEEINVDDYINSDDFSGYKMQGDGNYREEDNKERPVATRDTLMDLLLQQLGFLHLSDRQYRIGEQIIGTIEEDGYIRRDLQSIVNDLAFAQNIDTDLAEVEDILSKIQQFEPAGIAARDLQECLLLQLQRRPDRDQNPAVQHAIRALTLCFEEFKKKHFTKIQKRLGIEEEDLKDAVDMVIRLNPKPGGVSGSFVRTQYVIPDFTIKSNNGKLDIILNSKNAPDLHVSPHYSEMFETYNQSDKKDKKMRQTVSFVKQKLDAAKWFIDAIKQRQDTLRRTMQAILDYQREFFLDGDESKLRPMILKDIAEKIHMDISTVSRVANSKSVQTDFGVFPLKFFFSESISTDSGEDVSSKQVKYILRQIIEEENKSHPLSDDKLEKMLRNRGYQIARRTVAKYREQMNIPVARLRKEL